MDPSLISLPKRYLTFFKGAWGAVIGFFRSDFISPFFSAWHATRDFFGETFIKFFTETIPDVFKGAWDKVIGLFRGAANTIIGILNSIIRAVGKIPIPKVRVGTAYAGIGPVQVPYPTLSVSTRPLSSPRRVASDTSHFDSPASLTSDRRP